MTKKNDYLQRLFTFARQELLTAPVALRYLAARGVTEQQVYDLGLGYIPEDKWPPYIDPSKATEEESFFLDKSKKGYKLRGKVLFPMTNAMGSLRGFQVRSPNPDVKDYWKFYDLHSDVDAIFFGLDRAMPHIWRTEEIVLVEGIFDLFPVQRVFPNAVCVGTARISDLQLKFLQRHVKHVRFMFDNDEYGEGAYRKFRYEHSRDFQSVQNLSYLGKDPSESWARLGEAKFMAQFASGDEPDERMSLYRARLFGAL